MATKAMLAGHGARHAHKHMPVFRKRYCRLLCSIPPLDVALPGSNLHSSYLSASPVHDRSTLAGFRHTKLPGGIQVASEDSFGQFATFGVLIDAGSRNEGQYTKGLSHVLEKCAFQKTESFVGNDEINEEMEKIGGHVDCQTFRDCIIYAGSAFTNNLAGGMNVIAEAVWKPMLLDEEVDRQKEAVLFDIENLDFRPEPEPQLTDMIHSAAFRSNTLGYPKICPIDNLGKINRKEIISFMKTYYTPDRITVAGVNVNHEELVTITKNSFADNKPVWMSRSSNSVSPEIPVDLSVAQYTGGIVTDHRPQPRAQPGPNPLPELAHVAIGFESAPYIDDDFFAFAVLNVLLGGGGSFSAGGPGKGMYSRLYLNVLNRHHWMYSATAYNHSYADSGLFCIQASSHPSQVKDVVMVILQEFVNLINGQLHNEELGRAKKQLQSMLMMNLESRVVAFEDIGRQVLGLGHRKSPEELYSSIEMVTMDDLKRISEKMLTTPVSVAAIGNLNKLPSYEAIQKQLTNSTRTNSTSTRSIFNRF